LRGFLFGTESPIEQPATLLDILFNMNDLYVMKVLRKTSANHTLSQGEAQWGKD
jgi:hypothetical protein